MSLRHFWNNERSTNRALEEVQERRQQLKGPNAFIRYEQRLLNRAMPKDTRFAFIEEHDTSQQLTQAQVLKGFVEAMEGVQRVFQASIPLEGYLAWMQSLGHLPHELELVPLVAEDSGEAPASMSNSALETEGSDPQLMPQDGNETREEDPPAINLRRSNPFGLSYGEIAVHMDGRVLDRRLWQVGLSDVLQDRAALQRRAQARKNTPSAAEAWDSTLHAQHMAVQKSVQDWLTMTQDAQDILARWAEMQIYYDPALVRSVIDNVQQPLTHWSQEAVECLLYLHTRLEDMAEGVAS